jgi:hypothetical protein
LAHSLPTRLLHIRSYYAAEAALAPKGSPQRLPSVGLCDASGSRAYNPSPPRDSVEFGVSQFDKRSKFIHSDVPFLETVASPPWNNSTR